MIKNQDQNGPLTENLPAPDERMQQYLGRRYGQRSETRERYAEAIRACGDIMYLDKTVAEIARLFGHTDQRLRNQLQRHFPEVLRERDRLRVALGLNSQPLRGVSPSTEARYAPAIELLRTTSLTIREVAEHCGLTMVALQQHVLYHHRDLAEKRLNLRLNALDKYKLVGGISGTGRPNAPRKATQEMYAEALEMYRTTNLTVPEIALKCGVITHNFQCYLQRWCRSDMVVRKKLHQEKVERQRQKREEQGGRTRTVLAVRKYTPALQLIEEGATYEEAAEKLGIDVENLSRWVRKYHKDIHEQEHRNQIVTLPEGTTCTKASWRQFGEAAMAFYESDESVNKIADRFGLCQSSLHHFLVRKFPQTVARRKEIREG